MAKKQDSLDKLLAKLSNQKDIRAAVAKAQRLANKNVKSDTRAGDKAKQDVIDTLREMGKKGKHF